MNGTAILSEDGNDTVGSSGRIVGNVLLQNGDDQLVNSGKFVGDVLLGADDDTFIAKAGGTVSGTVNGGAGNNVFKIINNDLTLVDISGFDTIMSKVSHRSGADFEILELLGCRDLNDAGNASDNLILGNKGDNLLKGLGGDGILNGGKGADKIKGGAGEDLLGGGRGKDVLNGGGDADIFVFGDGDGRDKIKDFDASVAGEVVDMTGLSAIKGFSDLKNNHMTQVGNDVVIDASGGDVLTLLGVDAGDLRANDFLFVV